MPKASRRLLGRVMGFYLVHALLEVGRVGAAEDERGCGDPAGDDPVVAGADAPR